MLWVLQWIVFLPLVLGQGPAASAALGAWDWPAQGHSSTWNGPALSSPAWHYDWTATCAEPDHIPMVWSAGAEAAVGACNDGRPLLVLNEPERHDQANTPPDRAADLLHRVAGRWVGEIWCCGTDATALDYALAVVDSYQARYGAWPATGWHVHAYANSSLQRNARGWIPDAEFRSLVAPWRAEATLQQVDAFAMTMRMRGVLGRGIILSEYGALSATYWHQPADLVPIYRAYRAGIARRPYIISAAWFAAYDRRFDASNLLTVDGRLTPLGIEAQRAR